MSYNIPKKILSYIKKGKGCLFYIDNNKFIDMVIYIILLTIG